MDVDPLPRAARRRGSPSLLPFHVCGWCFDVKLIKPVCDDDAKSFLNALFGQRGKEHVITSNYFGGADCSTFVQLLIHP